MSGVGWTKGRWERAFLAEAAVYPLGQEGAFVPLRNQETVSVLRGV